MVPTKTHPFHGLWKATTGAAFALIAGAAVFTANIGSAQAVVMTSCGGPTCTLTQLLSGETFIVNDKVFSDWFYDGAGSDDIIVSGLDDGGLDPGPGLHFSMGGTHTVGAMGAIMDSLGFIVTAGPGFLIKDNSLHLTAFETGIGGTVMIDETVGGLGAPDGGVLGFKHVDPFMLTDSALFPPQGAIGVSLTLSLLGPIIEIPPDFGPASIDEFELRFSQVQVQVPEPGALALFAFGLVGLGLARRRRSV